MDNKAIAKQFIENLFVDNDKAYEVVDANVRVNWPGWGMEDLVGRDTLRSFMDKDGPNKVIDQKITNLVSEGNTVIVTGTIITERKGKEETSHFADVYTISDGKITHLESYMVMDQTPTNQQP